MHKHDRGCVMIVSTLPAEVFVRWKSVWRKKLWFFTFQMPEVGGGSKRSPTPSIYVDRLFLPLNIMLFCYVVCEFPINQVPFEVGTTDLQLAEIRYHWMTGQKPRVSFSAKKFGKETGCQSRFFSDLIIWKQSICKNGKFFKLDWNLFIKLLSNTSIYCQKVCLRWKRSVKPSIVELLIMPDQMKPLYL